MTSRDDAWAGLAEDVGKALLLFAERLRTAQQATGSTAPAGRSTRPEDPETGLGASQLKVFDALRKAGSTGLTSGEAAKQTGLKDTNTPRILKALSERGLATATDTKPTVWKATT